MFADAVGALALAAGIERFAVGSGLPDGSAGRRVFQYLAVRGGDRAAVVLADDAALARVLGGDDRRIGASRELRRRNGDERIDDVGGPDPGDGLFLGDLSRQVEGDLGLLQ